MNVLDSIKMAFSSIFAHKLRSILTMLGIIIGVGAVIAIVAIGQGGEAALKSQFAGTGNNTLEIFYEGTNEEYMTGNFADTHFDQSDVDDLQRLPYVQDVITTNQEYATLQHHQETMEANANGIDMTYYELSPVQAVQGRLLQQSDIDQSRRVTVISESVQEELFAGEQAVGQVIDVAGHPFEIVGVFERDNSGLFALQIDEILIPLSVWPMVFSNDEIHLLTLQATDADTLTAAGEQATDLLNRKKDVRGQYAVMNMEEIQEGISQITNVMTIIIGSVAGVSLFVGGIGVMNIMLVSVTERTREIGLRKALGATRGKILLQFLIESMTLTTVGGMIGIALGAGLAQSISYFAGWPPLVSLPVILVGLLFSMIIGVIFGLLPANKAAKMDPIDALRYE